MCVGKILEKRDLPAHMTIYLSIWAHGCLSPAFDKIRIHRLCVLGHLQLSLACNDRQVRRRVTVSPYRAIQPQH